VGPLVFVDDLDDPVLDPADRHHLERVLRVRAGDPITVSDGRGRWRPCRFGPVVEATGPAAEEARLAPPVTIAFALAKGDRPELVVQKLTELGVDRLVPFVAARSVVRPDPDRTDRQHERLVAVARGAAMQSRRCHLPVLDPVTTFAAAAALAGAALADAGGEPPSLARPTLLVGPEGGWEAAERAAGLPIVALGTNTLRTETAAIVAGALLTALRAGLTTSPA
jgi:16S rRNA (uracil1498-N3)-methyltransferase